MSGRRADLLFFVPRLLLLLLRDQAGQQGVVVRLRFALVLLWRTGLLERIEASHWLLFCPFCSFALAFQSEGLQTQLFVPLLFFHASLLRHYTCLLFYLFLMHSLPPGHHLLQNVSVFIFSRLDAGLVSNGLTDDASSFGRGRRRKCSRGLLELGSEVI